MCWRWLASVALTEALPVAQEVLDELIGLVGPLHNLLDNLTWTIVLHWLILFTFFFVPFQMGSTFLDLILQCDDAATEHMAWSFAVGYACLGLGCYLYYAAGDPDTSIRRLLVFLAVFLKVWLLLTIEIMAFPIAHGWWLDVCSLSLQNTTLANHIEFYTSAPL